MNFQRFTFVVCKNPKIWSYLLYTQQSMMLLGAHHDETADDNKRVSQWQEGETAEQLSQALDEALKFQTQSAATSEKVQHSTFSTQLLHPLPGELLNLRNLQELAALVLVLDSQEFVGLHQIDQVGSNLWHQLQDLGFPLVIVTTFDEVTPENVARWWSTLSPRLESFSRNCISDDGFWRMVTGEVPCL